MDRREFLKLAGLVTLWPLSVALPVGSKIKATAVNRLEKWQPQNTLPIEWRYAAGRISDSSQDFGFIISMSAIKITGAESLQFSVQRQNFNGDQESTSKTYTGLLTYDFVSATYTFQDENAQTLATWQWDDQPGQQVYKLTVTTPELTLTNVVLKPRGSLIPEGGSGNIHVGQIAGIYINSDYHGDWTSIEINGQEKGVARVDMQGLRQVSSASQVMTGFGVGQRGKLDHSPVSAEAVRAADSTDDYDHYWFAVAVELNDGPAWISAWRIEDTQGPFWGLTIARYSGASWQVVLSLTEQDNNSIAAPLEVTTLAWQNLPASADSKQSTGMKWRLTAGVNQLNDAVDIQVSVPPGQFISNTKHTLGGWLEEGVGLEVEGTVLGNPISSIKMAAAETTAEFSLNFLPVVLK